MGLTKWGAVKMFVLLFRDKDQKGKLIGLQTLPFEQRLLRVYKAEMWEIRHK